MLFSGIKGGNSDTILSSVTKTCLYVSNGKIIINKWNEINILKEK